MYRHARNYWWLAVLPLSLLVDELSVKLVNSTNFKIVCCLISVIAYTRFSESSNLEVTRNQTCQMWNFYIASFLSYRINKFACLCCLLWRQYTHHRFTVEWIKNWMDQLLCCFFVCFKNRISWQQKHRSSPNFSMIERLKRLWSVYSSGLSPTVHKNHAWYISQSS